MAPTPNYKAHHLLLSQHSILLVGEWLTLTPGQRTNLLCKSAGESGNIPWEEVGARSGSEVCPQAWVMQHKAEAMGEICKGRSQ